MLLLKKCRSGGEPFGNSVTDLIGPRFEPQTFRSKDNRVTSRQTARYITTVKYILPSFFPKYLKFGLTHLHMTRFRDTEKPKKGKN